MRSSSLHPASSPAVLVLRTPCEHGLTYTHETSACWEHEGRHEPQPDCYCPGGVETVLDPTTIVSRGGSD